MMTDTREKVLLDTDIGTDIDDAVALAYLLSQERCDLVGITTVTGEPQRRAEMASAMCRHVGRDDIPIHSGAAQAMLIDMSQKTAPQAAALGAWSRRTDFAPNEAVEFLRRTIRRHPGEVTLLTIGPLTNAGLLLATDPEIPALLKRMVLMCGQFFTSMSGEWNAVGDPHATAIAYGNGHQSRPPRHVSFGLDVTLRCVLPADECRRRFAARALQPVRDFAEVWFAHGAQGITFHDPLAAACIFEPDLCRYKQGHVRVLLHDPTAGWTVFRDQADGPHSVAAQVDAGRFFEHYFSIVK